MTKNNCPATHTNYPITFVFPKELEAHPEKASQLADLIVDCCNALAPILNAAIQDKDHAMRLVTPGEGMSIIITHVAKKLFIEICKPNASRSKYEESGNDMVHNLSEAFLIVWEASYQEYLDATAERGE